MNGNVCIYSIMTYIYNIIYIYEHVIRFFHHQFVLPTLPTNTACISGAGFSGSKPTQLGDHAPPRKKYLICFVVMPTSGKTHPFPVVFVFVHGCFRKSLVQFSTKLTCENQEWHSTERLCTAAVSQRRWCKVLLYQATTKQQWNNNLHLDGNLPPG